MVSFAVNSQNTSLTSMFISSILSMHVCMALCDKLVIVGH